MKSFTDIGQFREVIRSVKTHHDYHGKDENGEPIYGHLTPYPILKFRGTVKLHGTNAGIRKEKDGSYWFQSRENDLSLEKDNARFYALMNMRPYERLFDGIQFEDTCVIYGEWCGENIQKGVAITQLPKMFVIFAVRIDDVYMDLKQYSHLRMPEHDIYNILDFPHWEMDIDFNEPELVQNKLIDLTMAVEAECPVGKQLGVTGTGEGIVWEHVNGPLRYIFKVKGEKHQNSKVKTLTTVNVEEVENMKAFIEYAVTENRMKQGIDKMIENHVPLELKSTGEYLRWVYNDVIKEESDTILKNGIDVKKLGSAVSAKARMYWMNHINSML
jgi:hypothetical protein